MAMKTWLLWVRRARVGDLARVWPQIDVDAVENIDVGVLNFHEKIAVFPAFINQYRGDGDGNSNNRA